MRYLVRLRKKTISVGRRLLFVLCVGLLLSGSLAGCGRGNAGIVGEADGSSKRYPFSGKVTGINREARRVVFDHDEIPGYMEAMRGMPFPVKEDRWFNELKVGDQIRATLIVTNDNRSWLEEIEVTGRIAPVDLPSPAAHASH